MGYERYPRDDQSQGDYYGRNDTQRYGQEYGAGRSGGSRDYPSSGGFGRGRDDGDRRPYGQRDYGHQDYGRDDAGRQSGGFGGSYGGSYGSQGRYQDQDRHGERGRYGEPQGRSGYGARDEGRGGYGGDRYGQPGGDRYGSQSYGPARQGGGQRDRGGDYGRQPQGYDYDERGFLARAGDEVRSWFGDEDAERRRETDSRYDERYYAQQDRHGDSDYHSWRSGQMAALDRDYNEYRQENRSRFENEFSTWRNQRQTQRASLEQVKEHDEVVGSDGSHVGTVDKVRGDRILLTKNDADAGGQHHSIPSRWISSVAEKKVTLSKTADEAKQHWRNEEENQALFGYGDRGRDDRTGTGTGSTASSSASAQSGDKGTNLNSSFSGTY